VTTSECDSGASKVLVVCGVAGQFERVFKRVQQLHASSAGPFDLVLCVGRFFATPSGAQLADDSTSIALHQLSDYVAGFRQVPLPTYFIAGPDEDRFLPGTREQLAPNLFYLGRFGIARLRGLRIAYVSGQFGAVPDACSPFLRSGFDSLVATWASDVRRGVDVLLTNEWPRHLLAGVPDAALPASMAVADASAVGVDGVVAVARALKPRYHFAPAVNGAFYLRPPYANRASATDFGRTHVTRFVALAPADNTDKQKYVYAINVTPIEAMDDAAVSEVPANSTQSPFVLADAAADASAPVATSAAAAAVPMPTLPRLPHAGSNLGFVRSGGAQQAAPQKRSLPAPNDVMAARFADVRYEAQAARGGRGAHEHAQKRARVQQAARPCWFCLKSPDVEKHLIVSVANDTYVALPKGGLVDDHLLVVAIDHVQKRADMSDAGQAEVDKYKQSCARYYASIEREPLFYERFVLLHNEAHMHIQVVPMPLGSSDAARGAFLAAAAQRGITLLADTKPETLGGQYLHVELADGTSLTQSVGVAAQSDIQFARRVCAELLGKPEAADWKKCAVDKQAETALCGAVRKRFAAFDFSLSHE
jgi:hypothetical protein